MKPATKLVFSIDVVDGYDERTGYTETVTITMERHASLNGEFRAHMQRALADWFLGDAMVCTEETYNRE